MQSKGQSATDVYMGNVFKTLLLFIPAIALCAGLTFLTIKLCGFYEQIEWLSIILFLCSCIVYFVIGLCFFFLCKDGEGNLKPGSVQRGKIVIAVIEVVQWNAITYLFPSREYWAYSLFFAMLVAFFLDSKYMAAVIGAVLGSMVVSWFVLGDVLLPAPGPDFIPDMILRGVLITLAMVCLWFFTYSMEKRLLGELEKMADVDPLTMLNSRRCLDSQLGEAVKRAESGATPCAVMMADLDNFKRINDTYGHEAGDEVLKAVAQTLRYAVGEKGTVYRFGGEEIFVLFRVGEAEAYVIAEEARERVEKRRIVYEEKELSVTLTLGLAVYGEKADTPARLIKAADANLYYGKNHGKNQVVV